MTKSPPQRRGIRFEVGAQLEARDSLRNWYVANIEKIDYEDEKVLIHYRQWSHRYDEWFDWSSPYLRPMQRIQLRKQGLSEPRSAPGFHINQKVLASWSDCRYYPAKILSRDKDGSYTVKFFDGVVKTVKGIKVKPFRKQSSGQTRRRREWSGSGSRHSASDQERETDSEEDEGEISVMDELQAAFPEENSEPSDTTETSAGPDQNHQTIPNGGEKNQKDDAVPQDSPSLPRRTRSRATDGKDPERSIGPELRKRRASTGQTPASKRSRAGSSTDKSSRSQIKPVKMESVTSESADAPAVTPVTSEEPDLALAVKRQVHLPTTNKYSREPLYRVIKNQPPPILSIELDHNPFKCETPGCPKSFRKASLLHYHMKYYHAQSDPSSAHKPSPPSSAHKPSPETTPRRRRSSPGTKENRHLNRPPHDDQDWVAKETGEAKESERLREKPQRDFLRIKLKKRKKKKSKSGEESSSGLSSDGPLWSEDDSEDELNSERGPESVTHGAEIVRCICEVQEENDFMIQCDECFCWQHGTCMGLYEDSVPDNYSCYVCRDPPAQRPSQRFWFDKDWLSSGHMHGLSFLEENYSHQNSKKVTATHQLLGDVQRVFEVLNGLQLKMSILQTQAHPELKLWRQPWKPTSGLRRRGVATPTPPSPPDTGSDGLEKSAFSSHSYIFSDHCYQKPFTYYPALERRLVVETRGGSELEDSLRTSEDLLEMAEQRYGMMEQEQHKLQLTERSFSKELESRMKCLVSGEKTTCLAEVKQEEPDSKPDPDLLLHQQWQLNLLQHIEAVQDQVTHRMDLIERELDVLESWLDYTGELEPPEPLARLPQLKRRIRQLLADLGTVQQMALCSSLPV